MKLLITGTPGVGKTTLAKQLAEATKIEHIELTEFIKKHKLYEKYDKKFDTLIFDEDKVIQHLNRYVEDKNSFIIDTHSPIVACYINFDVIFHLICSTRVLYDRLSMRNYSKDKIDENISSEIFNVIGEELDELFETTIYRVNCTDQAIEDADLSRDEAFDLIVKSLSEN